MEKLAGLDAQSIAARCGLKSEGNKVFLTLLGTEYEIEVPSFERKMVSGDSTGLEQDNGVEESAEIKAAQRVDISDKDGAGSATVPSAQSLDLAQPRDPSQVLEQPRDYLADKNAQVLVLHFLTESSFAPSNGKFISFREYPSGDLYFKAFEGRCLKRLAFSYGTKIDAFVKDCEVLNAKKIKGGDAAYEIGFFPGLSLQLMIWGPDEEFPPSAQILFSDNMPISFSAEGVCGLCDVLIGALKKANK